MSLIPPYNSLANKIQQALNQFKGQPITPYLKAQLEATVQNVLAYEDPYNDIEVDVVIDAHGQTTVNMKQKGPHAFREPTAFNKKSIYKRHLMDRWRLNDDYMVFVHDPQDIEPGPDALDMRHFFLY